MKLTDCTKAELLWVIDRADSLSLGGVSDYISRALIDLKFEREMARLKKADELAKTAKKYSDEYMEILAQYDGKKFLDIPADVLRKADRALQRSREANAQWAKLMGIKIPRR